MDMVYRVPRSLLTRRPLRFLLKNPLLTSKSKVDLTPNQHPHLDVQWANRTVANRIRHSSVCSGSGASGRVVGNPEVMLKWV
jgi:hypothetical protein